MFAAWHFGLIKNPFRWIDRINDTVTGELNNIKQLVTEGDVSIGE